MRAAVCTGYGGPEVLRIAQRARPVPGPGEVLVRVLAASVASGDVRVRGLDVPAVLRPALRVAFGWRRPRRVLGTECAGVVAAVGPGCRMLRAGDAVVAFPGTAQGCHAEWRVMPEGGRIIARPPGLSDAEAGAMCFGGSTALAFLRGVVAGQRVLVIGGAGVVGNAAVQIAVARGATVAAVVRPEHRALMARLGAEAFDRDGDDPGGGWDLILDTAGQAAPSALRRRLATGGRLALVDAQPGAMLAAMLRRDTQAGPAPERRADMQVLADLVGADAFRPLVDRVYPLDRIAEAHARAMAPGRAGAVVVVP